MAAGSPRVWNPKETFTLIKLWKAYPCLWMKDSKDYRNKEKKSAAIRKISDTLGMDTAEIVRKCHNLRCGMNTELRKARAKAANGLVYYSSWAYYRALMFIADEAPNPQKMLMTAQAEQEESEGNVDVQTADWPTIVAMYGNVDPAVTVQGVMADNGLNNDFYDGLNDSQQYQSVDDPNGDASHVDDFVQEESLPIESCTTEIQSVDSPSDDDAVQEIPLTDGNPSANLEIKTYPPQKKQRLDKDPEIDEYPTFGKFMASELRIMRSDELRKHLQTLILRLTADAIEEDDMETALSSSNGCPPPSKTKFDKSGLESTRDYDLLGQVIATVLVEIKSEERRKRLKRTIQRVLLDVGEEDDMEYSVVVSDRR